MKQKIKTLSAFVVIGVVAFATMWFVTGLSDPVAAGVGLIVAYLLLLPLGLSIGFTLGTSANL